MGNGKKHTPEEIASLLQQIDAALANGTPNFEACKERGITVQTYYRWRKVYSIPKPLRSKRLKELEQENEKLKRLVAELSLEKQILQDIARGI